MRVVLWAGVFVSAAAATIALGLGLLVVPQRTATLLWTYFAVFPQPASRRSRLLYRVFGGLLTAFGATYGVDAVWSVLRIVLGKP